MFTRNVSSIIALEVMWAVGSAFITLDIVSALIYSIDGSPLLVATVSIASGVLLYAPQFLVPYFRQRMRRVIGGAALGQAVIVLGFVLTAISLWAARSHAILQWAVVVCVVLSALGNAFTGPFYQQLRMRLLPARTRSASYSTVLFFSQVAGTLGALAAIPLLRWREGPTQVNYCACFIVASVLCTGSTLCFAFMRDPAPDPAPAPGDRLLTFSEIVRGYIDTLRADRNLRVFLCSEWLNWLAAMGGTFLSYYAVKTFGQTMAGPCNFVRFLGAILTVPLAHVLVSRHGSRSTIITFYVLSIVMYLGLAMPPTRPMILAASFLVGMVTILRVNYLFHFITALSPEEDKSRYYALCNAAVSPMTLIGPLFGGVMIEWLIAHQLPGFRIMFALSAVPLAVAAWMAVRMLKDPVGEAPDVSPVPRASLKRMTG